MTFTELLEASKKLDIYKITVAREVECYGHYDINDDGDQKKLTKKDFETVCNYIYDFFLQDDSGKSIEQLVGGLFLAISKSLIEIDDIRKDINKVDEAVLDNIF